MFASTPYGAHAPPTGARTRAARRPRPATVPLLLLVAGLAATAALAATWLRNGAPAEPLPTPEAIVADPPSVPAVAEDWRDAPDGPPRFTMQRSPYGPVSGTRVRLRSGGGRQDILTVGAADSASGLLHLAVVRPAPETASTAGFFVTLARGAAAEGLAVLRSDQPDTIATRYGVMEIAGTVVGRGGATRACLGYRLRSSAPDLQIAGFACDGSGLAPSREKLVCALETLAIQPGETDRDVADFFTAAAFRHSPGCVKPVDVAPTASTNPARAAPKRRHRR